MKFFIETLGCKVNTYESEVMKSNMLDNGFIEAKDISLADIIIINTCSVTNQSDAKSRKVIRTAKRSAPNSIVVVCGCSAQNNKEKLLKLDVDILIGNKDKSKVVKYIKDYLETYQKQVKFYDLKNEVFEDMTISNYENRTRAFVKIQDGCNNYCSYCIIPYLRGNIRNKDYYVAISEIKALVDNGFKEIVLTGIHTGSYPNLVNLIKEISKFEKLERIRISSIEITELNDGFLEELKNNNKICDHLHIPIQSGSDNVLKMMNRKYDIKYFKSIISKIREIRPNINITTDLIVGFPTETKEDFSETIKNINEINFGKIHVFPYSKRDGTLAATFKNIVKDSDKKDRTNIMLDLSNKLEKEYYEKFINKKLSVIIEEVDGDLSVGHTSNYIKVYINKALEKNKTYDIIISNINDGKVNAKLV